MKKLIFIFLALFFILTPVFIFSQEIQYPPAPGAPTPTATTTFSEYVKWIFNFSIIIGGILVFLMFVLSGIDYLISGLFPERKIIAKERAIRSFFGLLILLSVYLILYTINPQLTILSLPPLTPATTTPPTSTSIISTTTFQEIPIGTLVENILAKNFSCFYYGPPNAAGIAQINLIDCRTKGFISVADGSAFATTTFYPNSSTTELFGTTTIDSTTTFYYSSTTKIYSTQYSPFYYCYDYDSDGNKKELLKNHDRYDCIKNLLEAMKIKNEKLKVLVDELKTLSGNLKDKSLDLKTYAESCSCAVGCSWSCSGCGCNNSNCSYSGPTNRQDNCPDRNDMNTLRTATIPNLIEQIEKKRIEIYAFIYGAATSTASYTIRWYGNDDSYTTSTTIYYLPAWDPATTTTFLTFDEGLVRLDSFISDLNQDLNDLREAEELMKSPYGDRLTLVELLDVKNKSKEIINTLQFKGYDITSDYCRDINCTATDTNSICNECQLNPDRLCKRYVSSGDNTTFYENKNYLEEETLTKEKCTIEPKIEKGFPLGLIPIGETVDEAEEFASSTLGELRKIWNNSTSIEDNALDAREKARLQIEKAYELIELTSEGTDNSKNCVVNCQDVPCSPGGCNCFVSGSCGCCSEYCSCLPYYSINCVPPYGTICPWTTITNTYNSILGYYNNISTNLSNITALTNIIIFIQRYTDLTEAVNLLPGDPNKCTIFDKQAISRLKLTQCFTGYGTPENIGMAKMRVFSSKIALDLVYLGKIVILPDFPYPASTTVLNSYPFNSEKLTPTQKNECLINPDSTDKCQTYIKDLMDNYYCCEGE